MTKAGNRVRPDSEPAMDERMSIAPRKRQPSGNELDAEIVRDLEVDPASDDVRGGNCPYSLTKGQ